jgi:hypothetical protein
MRETSANEPLKTHRKCLDGIKTGELLCSGMSMADTYLCLGVRFPGATRLLKSLQNSSEKSPAGNRKNECHRDRRSNLNLQGLLMAKVGWWAFYRIETRRAFVAASNLPRGFGSGLKEIHFASHHRNRSIHRPGGGTLHFRYDFRL